MRLYWLAGKNNVCVLKPRNIAMQHTPVMEISSRPWKRKSLYPNKEFNVVFLLILYINIFNRRFNIIVFFVSDTCYTHNYISRKLFYQLSEITSLRAYFKPGARPPTNDRGHMIFYATKAILSLFFYLLASLAINVKYNLNRNMAKTR